MTAFDTPAVGHSTKTQAIRFLDTLSFVRVAGAETDGRQSVVEMRLREDHAPPLHVHDDADETIHVVDGEVAVHTTEETRHLEAGSSVVLPRGEPHSLHALTQATIVASTSPAGFEAFVTAVGEPTDERTVPTEPPTDAAIGRVNELAAEHDIRIVGPPPVGPDPDPDPDTDH